MGTTDKEIVDRAKAGAAFARNWLNQRRDVLRENIRENRSILDKAKELVTGKPSLSTDDVIRTAGVPIVQAQKTVSDTRATIGGETVVRNGTPVEIRIYPRAIRDADANGTRRNFRGEYAETTGTHEQGHANDEAAKNAMSQHILRYLRDHKLLGLVMDGFSGTEYKTPDAVSAEIYAGVMEARRKRQANPDMPATKEDYEAGSVLPEALINSRLSPEDLVNIDNTTASYSPEELKTMAASKGGNAPGESKSSGVPSGHNTALDGYSGPRIVINPSTFHNAKDGLCVAYNEAIRVFMEANNYEPQSEPTDRQRQFFADTPYADDELQLRRTIIARVCVFDTSVKGPTDDQLSESASVLRAIIDSGFAKTDDEITKCERLARAIEAAVGAEPVEPKEEPLEARPLQPNEETQAAIYAGETEEEAMKRLAAGDTGKTLQEDTSTLEERQQFLKERGMDEPLAETGSMDTLVKMHEQNVQGSVGAEGLAQVDAQEPPVQQGTAAVPQQEQPPVQPVAQAQEQPVQQAAAAPQQETLAPGLSRSGSRNNVLEFNGRRISQREFDRIQAKFREGGAQQPQAAAAAQPAQVAANDEEPLKPNKLRQTVQVDSGRRDALGRRLDDRGRVIA